MGPCLYKHMLFPIVNKVSFALLSASVLFLCKYFKSFIFQLFLNCLCNLQHNLILCEIDTEKLFCNIPEIYFANRSFWHHHIFPMLQVSCQPAGSAISVFLLTCKCKHSEKFWQKILFLSVLKEIGPPHKYIPTSYIRLGANKNDQFTNYF